MLRWAEYSPVSETMVKLLTFPSVAGAAASYQVRTKSPDYPDEIHFPRLSASIPLNC